MAASGIEPSRPSRGESRPPHPPRRTPPTGVLWGRIVGRARRRALRHPSHPRPLRGLIPRPIGRVLSWDGLSVASPTTPVSRWERPSFSMTPLAWAPRPSRRLRLATEGRGPAPSSLACASAPARRSRRSGCLPSLTLNGGGRARCARRAPPLRSGALPTARLIGIRLRRMPFLRAAGSPLEPPARRWARLRLAWPRPASPRRVPGRLVGAPD